MAQNSSRAQRNELPTGWELHENDLGLRIICQFGMPSLMQALGAAEEVFSIVAENGLDSQVELLAVSDALHVTIHIEETDDQLIPHSTRWTAKKINYLMNIDVQDFEKEQICRQNNDFSNSTYTWRP